MDGNKSKSLNFDFMGVSLSLSGERLKRERDPYSFPFVKINWVGNGFLCSFFCLGLVWSKKKIDLGWIDGTFGSCIVLFVYLYV